MGWYVFELAAYLFVAIFFGIVVGWLIWGDEPFEVTTALAGSADEETVADLSSQVETRDQEILRLRKRLKRMHADLDARDAQATATKSQVEELQTLLQQRDDELASVGAGGDEYQVRRLAELEEELASSKAQSTELARQLQVGVMPADAPSGAVLESLQAEFDQLFAAHRDLEGSYHGLADELAETQARLDEASATSNAGAQSGDRIRTLETELAQLRADTQGALQRAKVAEARLDEERQAAQARASRETDHVTAGMQGTIDQLAAESTGLRARIAELEASIADGAARINTVAASGGDDDEVRFELSKVQTELARSRQNVNSLRQRLQELEDENEVLAGDLARATNELRSRSSKASEFDAERQRFVADRDQFESRLADLNIQMQSFASRSGDHERESAELRGELETVRQELLVANDRSAEALQRQQVESEAELASLHMELSDARLRADAAYDALQELTQEFIVFRESTLRQQTTVNALAERLDRARTTLVGRSSAPMLPEDAETRVDDLAKLPSMSPELLAHLSELGVTSYDEIAAWTPADLSRIEATLGEAPGTLVQRGWVAAAAALLASRQGQ
jgi:chromosome segregation ATPase